MARKLLLCLVRGCALFAVVLSALLYIHYLAPAETGLCGASSGCESVRRSGFGYFFGSPYFNMPLLGVVSYGGLFAATLGGGWYRHLSVLRWLFTLGGVGALGLVLVQAVYLGTFCAWCMAVDASAIGAAFSILLIPRQSDDGDSARSSQLEGLATWAWLCLLALAIGLPALWVQVKPAATTPSSILALAEPGRVNIVEFADFECPFCRELHPVLARVLARHHDAVHLTRLHMPLPRHPNAAAAARAAVCADQAGRGEAMADRLFSGDLDPETIAAHAAALGLDATAFRACQSHPSTQARIDRDIALLRAADFQGLPTTYIGSQRIIGLAAEEVLEEAILREISGGAPPVIPTWLFVLLASVAALGVVRQGLLHEAT